MQGQTCELDMGVCANGGVRPQLSAAPCFRGSLPSPHSFPLLVCCRHDNAGRSTLLGRFPVAGAMEHPCNPETARGPGGEGRADPRPRAQTAGRRAGRGLWRSEPLAVAPRQLRGRGTEEQPRGKSQTPSAGDGTPTGPARRGRTPSNAVENTTRAFQLLSRPGTVLTLQVLGDSGFARDLSRLGWIAESPCCPRVTVGKRRNGRQNTDSPRQAPPAKPQTMRAERTGGACPPRTTVTPPKSPEEGLPLGHWGRGHTRASREPACRGQGTELPFRDAVLG